MKCFCHLPPLVFLSFLNSELHSVISQLLFCTWHSLCAFCALNYLLRFGVDSCWSFLILLSWLLYSKPLPLQKHCLSLNCVLSFQCWKLNFFLLVLFRKSQAIPSCDNWYLFTRIIISFLSSILEFEKEIRQEGREERKRNHKDKR